MSPAPPSSPKPSAIVRAISPASLRPAATAPVPADDTHPTGPSMPARSAAKASLVMRRGPPSPIAATRASNSRSSEGQSTPASANAEAAISSRRQPESPSASSTA